MTWFLLTLLCWQTADEKEQLKKMAAERDRHDALFTSGYARYALTFIKGRNPHEGDVEVWFSGSRIRQCSTKQQELYDGKCSYHHINPGPNTMPIDYVVVFRSADKKIYLDLYAHPAWLGHRVPGNEFIAHKWTVGDSLRRAATHGEDTAAVDQVGEFVKVTYKYTKAKVVHEFTMDPKRSYALVRFREYGTDSGYIPTEADFEYDRPVDQPPHVATKVTQISRTYKNGVIFHEAQWELRLLEFRLENVPNEKFTLEDFKLPNGARLRNARTGEESPLGVEPPAPEAMFRGMGNHDSWPHWPRMTRLAPRLATRAGKEPVPALD